MGAQHGLMQGGRVREAVEGADLVLARCLKLDEEGLVAGEHLALGVANDLEADVGHAAVPEIQDIGRGVGEIKNASLGVCL